MKKKSKYLEFRWISKDRRDVIIEGRVKVGELLIDVDGCFYFFLGSTRDGVSNNLSTGAWPAHILIAIGQHLDKINSKWDKKVNDYFDKRPSEPDTVEEIGIDVDKLDPIDGQD